MIDLLGYLAYYLFAGAVWCFWLESFTTRELNPPYNMPWTNKERLYHICLWPMTLGVFAWGLCKELFGNKHD